MTGEIGRYSRRDFMKSGLLLLSGTLIAPLGFSSGRADTEQPVFTLKPIGRSFALADYYIWCSSAIWGEDGKVHLFYSRWKKEKGMSGWLRGSEIAQAVADRPDAPCVDQGVVLQTIAGYWDSTTCHNPLIQKVDNTYYLFYMSNSNGKTQTKRTGINTAKILACPWQHP